MVEAEKKRVAIVGGGPSGLVCAKCMLDVDLAPTLFETKSNVGGLWAPPVDGVKSHQLNPEMFTNSSRFTSMFSDLFVLPKEDDKVQLYTTAVTVGNYLNSYAKQLLSKATIRLSTTVTSVSPETEGDYPEWHVISKDSTGKEISELYQYVIIATGMFSNQYIPYAETLKHFKGTAVHTGDHSGSEQLIDPKGKTVMVVGGGISGAERCSDVGLRISSLPEEQRVKSRVINVYATPPRIMPKWLAFPNPTDPLAPKVLPADIVLFNPSATAPPAKSVVEKHNRINDQLTMLLGDQTLIDPELSTEGEWRNKTIELAISDSYDKFVRCGIIKPVRGRFGGVQEDGKVRVVDENGELLLGGPLDVDVLCFATGYSHHDTLQKILAPEVLAKVGFDPSTKNPSPSKVLNGMTNAMHKYVLAPGIGRTIGFAGLLRRAFWGIIEMQGRYLGGLFSGKIPWPAEDIVDFSKGSDHLISIGRVKDGLMEDTDFLSIVASYAEECGFDPFKPIPGQNHPPRSFSTAYIPALNPSGLEPRNSALSYLSHVLDEMADSPEFISKSIFTEMNGKWRITRKLTSQLPGFPDGEFTGTGYFRARLETFEPVRDKLGEYTVEPAVRRYSVGQMVSEYLYSEDGELVTKSGMKLMGKKSYVYRYDGVAEKITSWFVKPNGETVDYFFHDLSFEKQPEVIGGSSVDQPGGWKATGEHLCNKDRYYVAYRFAYKGSRLEKFWIRYKVVGPKKNYVSETEYVRL